MSKAIATASTQRVRQHRARKAEALSLGLRNALAPVSELAERPAGRPGKAANLPVNLDRVVERILEAQRCRDEVKALSRERRHSSPARRIAARLAVLATLAAATAVILSHAMAG